MYDVFLIMGHMLKKAEACADFGSRARDILFRQTLPQIVDDFCPINYTIYYNIFYYDKGDIESVLAH